MIYIILNTNVLVSALWQHLDYGNPARLVRLCIERRFGLVYSAAMYREYDAAQCWDAILVTGNTKHFPDDQRACTPADFLANRQL